jgi:hypothetical protein
MTQVDQVTQRNAAAAEQLSSTAEQLAVQAASLLKAMGSFQLTEAELQGRLDRAAALACRASRRRHGPRTVAMPVTARRSMANGSREQAKFSDGDGVTAILSGTGKSHANDSTNEPLQ